MPFARLTNSEVIGLFATHSPSWNDLQDYSLYDHICHLYGNTAFRSLNCSYMTPEHFCHSFRSNSIEFSVFHINIQCLNAKQRVLCQLLETLSVEFDVIVLSEVWSYNIQFYKNILSDYIIYTTSCPLIPM